MKAKKVEQADKVINKEEELTKNRKKDYKSWLQVEVFNKDLSE